jgi:transcription termination/antitermination protein NusA
VDIQSDAVFAQAEAEAAFAGGAEGEEFSGRCSAILANGKRCPNAAVPGSRFCGIPAHRELAEREARGETLEASQVVGGISDEEEPDPDAEATAEETEATAEETEATEETERVEEPVAEEPTVEEPTPEDTLQQSVAKSEEEPVTTQEPELEEPVEPQEAPVEAEVAVAAVEELPSGEEDEPSAA